MTSTEVSAERPWKLHYSADSVEIAIETPTLRVLKATFAPGQQVPWHRHTNICDHFWVVEGTLHVETKSPDQSFELGPGGYCFVAPGCSHRVTNIGLQRCRFVNLQGFGNYDFVKEGEVPEKAA